MTARSNAISTIEHRRNLGGDLKPQLHSSSKRYYPVGLDVNGKECLAVGGGRVAERKVKRLLEYGARITVVSPTLTPLLERWFGQGLFLFRQKKFSKNMIRKQCLVFALTDDLPLNRRIAREAQKKKILVNVAKPGKASSFILPSVLRRPSYSVAVSTEGRSPARAKKIRKKIEILL